MERKIGSPKRSQEVRLLFSSFFGTSQSACITHWSLLIYRLDDKLLITKGNISDFAPGKADLRGESGRTNTEEEDQTKRKAEGRCPGGSREVCDRGFVHLQTEQTAKKTMTVTHTSLHNDY